MLVCCGCKNKCGWVNYMECGEFVKGQYSCEAESGCLQELCKASNYVWK